MLCVQIEQYFCLEMVHLKKKHKKTKKNNTKWKYCNQVVYYKVGRCHHVNLFSSALTSEWSELQDSWSTVSRL